MNENIENPPQDEENPVEEPRSAEDAPEPQEAEETFPREYVEKLRKEAGDARVRAKKADDYAHRLHLALVTATGRLADPTDLPFDEDHLDGEDALGAAITALLEKKPHLASRRPRGDIGQGRMSDSPATVDLAAMLRSRA